MYENLVLSGGAIYGYTYIGALRILDKKKYLANIKKFAGTSVGGAICAFLACGASVEFIKNEMLDLEVSSLKDSSFVCKNLYRFVRKFGYYKGDRAYDWVSHVIDKLTKNQAITFKEVYEKYGHTLVIVGTSLKTKQAVYFSHENYPDMEIRLAVRISISIPLVYRAIEWNNDTWVDGGIVDNFPISYFDEEITKECSNWDGNCHIAQHQVDDLLDEAMKINMKKTLGLKPISHSEYHGKIKEVTNIVNYAESLIDTILQQVNKTPLNKYNQERTVIINAGKLSSMNFDLNDIEKVDLILRGEKYMEEFLFQLC